MKKIFYIVLLLTIMPFVAFAQNSVSGTVTDANGEPIPGVNVLLKGTSNGTSTDFDGLYSIQTTKSSDVLVFSYLGFKTTNELVGNRSEVNIILQSSNEQLDEIVIVGYGSVRKRDLTGSVAQVSSDELNNTATSNFDQALAGRVSGVQISSVDGTPGEGLNITIRGGNSITGDNSPLYVVDGIPMDDFDPGSISTNDIKSFDIQKDASATAIYGSRAANGVILITTKQGRKDGKTDVRISASHGVQWIPNRLETLSPYEYVKYQEQVALAIDNYVPGQYVGYFKESWVDPELYRDMEGTSWQDEIFRIASTNKYNASMSGGNSTTNVYFSTEFLDQEGTMINTGFKKIYNNLKFGHKINNKTKLNGYLQYTYLNRAGVGISGNSYTSVIRDAIQFRPVEPINSDGLEAGGYDPTDQSQKYLFNPVKNLMNTDRQRRSDVLRGSLGLTHRFNSDLVLKLSGSYQIDSRKETTFFGKDTQQGTRGSDHINGSVTNRRYQTLSSSNTLAYNKTIDQHRFSLLGGMEMQTKDYEYSWMKNSEIPTDLFGIDKIGLGISPAIPQTLSSRNALLSYFGRVNYNLHDKYLFTATYRADGSSKFNKDNRWGYFPSFSAAWKISDENFLKDVEAVSFAKVRAGWGITGNNRIGDYDAYSQLNASTSSGYVWGHGENYIPGAYQSNLGVPNLRWESTAQSNIGLDLGFLDQNIELTVDYYNKQTSDLLLNAEMALHTGFNKVQQNIGKVENKGLEISLNTTNINKDKFKWYTSFNISFNENKTIALNDGQTAIYTNPNWNGSYSEYQYITQVGQPVGMMYGLEFDRIYQLDDFNWDNEYQTYVLKEGVPDNGALPVGPGSVKFIDQNGDGTINELDREIIGNPHPKHFGGFSNTFEVGNFDVSALLQWSYGFDIMNANKAVFEVPTAGKQSGFAALSDAWSPLNTDTTVGAIRYMTVYGAPPKGNQMDDRYIEDGSYLKLKSVSVGYTLPNEALEAMKVKKFRIYLTGQNLFTWTKYSGYDPDVSVGKYGALTPRLDYSAYPQSTTIMGGIDITF